LVLRSAVAAGIDDRVAVADLRPLAMDVRVLLDRPLATVDEVDLPWSLVPATAPAAEAGHAPAWRRAGQHAVDVLVAEQAARVHPRQRPGVERHRGLREGTVDEGPV